MGDAFSLTGKLALVTGAASGIGMGIAEVLAEAGATVIIADVNEAGARDAADRLVAAGCKADAVAVDLSDEASVIHAVADVVSRHGAPWLLVNNAGLQDRQLLFEETVEGWDRTLAVNARGPFLMTREVAKVMVAAGNGGRIVNIASTALINMVAWGHAAYSSSKGALAALSTATALELLPHAITVNTVLPGGVATPGAIAAKGPPPQGPAMRMPPLGMCEPRDIGAAVLFFATPAARYVTNQSIAVDAGWSLS